MRQPPSAVAAVSSTRAVRNSRWCAPLIVDGEAGGDQDSSSARTGSHQRMCLQHGPDHGQAIRRVEHEGCSSVACADS